MTNLLDMDLELNDDEMHLYSRQILLDGWDIEAQEKLKDTFELLYSKKDEGFGNARVIRNIFEKCVQNQANRIVKLKKISNKVLKTFIEEDIPEPKETQKSVSFTATN